MLISLAIVIATACLVNDFERSREVFTAVGGRDDDLAAAQFADVDMADERGDDLGRAYRGGWVLAVDGGTCPFSRR